MATARKKKAPAKKPVEQSTEEFDTLGETKPEVTTPEPVAQRQSFRADVQPDNQVEHHLKQEAERAEARRLHQVKTEGRFDVLTQP